MTRVLVVTSHPVAPPWDSADKDVARVVTTEVTDFEHVYLRRAGRPAALPAKSFPIVSRTGKPGALERAQAAALSTLLQPTVDIVHVVMSVGPGFAQLSRLWRLLPRRARRPLVCTVPGVLPGARFALADRGAWVVALSDAGAHRLHELGAANVRVIPPGLILDRWPFIPPDRTADASILVPAHLEPASALDSTIEAIARARLDGRRPRLLVALRRRPGVGDAGIRALRRRAEQLGFEAGAIVEEVADMRPLIRSAAAVVYAPRDLAGKADVPLTLLEAMATGRPVITSDLPQLSALGDGVVRVPVGDRDALTEAVDSLDDETTWSQRVGSARRLVEQQFSAAAAGRAYASLYREVVARVRANG